MLISTSVPSEFSQLLNWQCPGFEMVVLHISKVECVPMLCDRGAFVPAAGNRSSHSLGRLREEVSGSFSILALLSWFMELEGLHSEH